MPTGRVPRSRVAVSVSGRMTLLSAILLGSMATPGPVEASIQYPAYPDWESTPMNQVATGAALRDLDGDGWPDLIIANGNDIYRQRVAVYRNQGGTFPLTPTWESGDIDYHGHLDLADVTGDGNLDLAVAVYLGPGGFPQPGYVKLYQGYGDGTFSPLPVWRSEDEFSSFRVAFGDINMNGRPDLACAAGEAYYRVKERARVYRNVGGVLESLPYWMSDTEGYSMDVAWGDINGDGILDLVVGGTSNPNDPDSYPTSVYLGDGTTLSTTPDWVNADGDNHANTICLADVNGNGRLDLAVCDNNQLGGSGRVKIFLNDAAGSLSALPDWVSDFSGYGAHVSFADVNFNGRPDLVSGSWWGRVRIYRNQNGTFPVTPTWQSASTSVVENIAWEDVNNDALRSPLMERFTGNGVRRHFVLPDRPVRPISVSLDGAALPEDSYFLHTEHGWISLSSTPPAGVELSVEYTASASLDFVVSNWDSGKGNYLFLNLIEVTGIGDMAERGLDSPLRLSLSPNPTSGSSWIRFDDPRGGLKRLDLFDTLGRRVRYFGDHDSSIPLLWDGLDSSGLPTPGGVYWLRVAGEGEAVTTRVVVVR